MEKFIYYVKGTNHDSADDVAITEAETLDDAIVNFLEYYTNASVNNVQLIDCNREGYVKNMMIISDY